MDDLILVLKWILNNVIPLVISALIGVLGYVAKEKYTEDKRIKYTSRLIMWDITGTVNLLNNSLNQEGIPFTNLTMFKDWKNEFAIISNKLSIKEARILVDYYQHINLLIGIQHEMRRIRLLSESDPEMVLKTCIKGVEQLYIGFKKESDKLIRKDLQIIIDKLKKIR